MARIQSHNSRLSPRPQSSLPSSSRFLPSRPLRTSPLRMITCLGDPIWTTPTTYLNHSPFFFLPSSSFGTASTRRRNVYRDRVTSVVAISSAMTMSCRNYRLDFPSAVLYGHSFPSCTFPSVSPLFTVITLSLSICGVCKVCRSVFFWSLAAFFCFHVCKTAHSSHHTR
jgi:hypothetical protein